MFVCLEIVGYLDDGDAGDARGEQRAGKADFRPVVLDRASTGWRAGLHPGRCGAGVTAPSSTEKGAIGLSPEDAKLSNR